MTMTLTQSRDAIGEVLKGIIDGLDTPPSVVFWDDVEPPPGDNPASPGATWIRAGIWPVGGDQVSVGSGDEGSGKFRHTGLVTIRVFTPLRGGLATSDVICQAFLDGLQGRSRTGVWFENVRAVHRGRFNQWYEQRVVADYRYDDNK